MDRFLNILTYAIGFLFLFNGLLWLISPENIASSLGMPLLTGHGLSTQIGDLASFFLVVGIFSLIGAYTKKPYWLYTPAALVGFAALSRIIAYLAHGAALSTDKIFVEVAVMSILLFVAKKN